MENGPTISWYAWHRVGWGVWLFGNIYSQTWAGKCRGSFVMPW